jgi:hypothetical protein
VAGKSAGARAPQELIARIDKWAKLNDIGRSEAIRKAYRALAATLGEAMNSVELALAVASGLVFAAFAYECWKQ